MKYLRIKNLDKYFITSRKRRIQMILRRRY